MSTVIHVNPNELEAVASTLKSHMREMDEAIRSACDALGSSGGGVSGVARGLRAEQVERAVVFLG